MNDRRKIRIWWLCVAAVILLTQSVPSLSAAAWLPWIQSLK